MTPRLTMSLKPFHTVKKTMGQAKAREQRESSFHSALTSRVDLPRLAGAMRKLATAASGTFGADCGLHAELTKALLMNCGVCARVAIGFAAWRVGNGDSDTIVHSPSPGAIIYSPKGADGLPFHVWLALEGAGKSWILDFTTYQLPQKAAELDALDGGRTQVDWRPDYLFTPTTRTTSLQNVTQGQTGLCYYEENAMAARTVAAKDCRIDPDDLAALQFLYEHPDTNVFGPNDVAEAEHRLKSELAT